MSKYVIRQRYYPDGKIKIKQFPVDENTMSSEKHIEPYDEYTDVFPNKEQATHFYKETLQC